MYHYELMNKTNRIEALSGDTLAHEQRSNIVAIFHDRLEMESERECASARKHTDQ